jgi:hypothetical protein
MIPQQVVTGVAPPGTPAAKRYWAKAQEWAKKGQVTPIDIDSYFQTPRGSQYKDYAFEP